MRFIHGSLLYTSTKDQNKFIWWNLGPIQVRIQILKLLWSRIKLKLEFEVIVIVPDMSPMDSSLFFFLVLVLFQRVSIKIIKAI